MSWIFCARQGVTLTSRCLQAGIQVPSLPDWYFVKLHTPLMVGKAIKDKFGDRNAGVLVLKAAIFNVR